MQNLLSTIYTAAVYVATSSLSFWSGCVCVCVYYVFSPSDFFSSSLEEVRSPRMNVGHVTVIWVELVFAVATMLMPIVRKKPA